MGIVGEQGLAAGTARARHDPVVGALAFDVAERAGPLLNPRGQLDTPGRCVGCAQLRGLERRRTEHPQLTVQATQIGLRGRLLAWVGGKELPQGLGVQHLQRRQPGQLVAPVTAQIQRHHERPARAVFGVPVAACGGVVAWVDAQDLKLGRQSLRPVRKKSVHPVAVGPQCLAGLVAEPRDLRLRRFADAQRAHQQVGFECRWAEHFRQRAAHDAAVEFQLPAALLRVHIAHRHPGVAGVFGEDVGDVAGVALHLHCGPQPLQLQFTIDLGQAAPRVQRTRHHGEHQQSSEPSGRAFQPAHSGLLVVPAWCHAAAPRRCLPNDSAQERSGPRPSTIWPSTSRKLTVGTLMSVNGAPMANSPSLCSRHSCRRREIALSTPEKRTQVP